MYCMGQQKCISKCPCVALSTVLLAYTIVKTAKVRHFCSGHASLQHLWCLFYPGFSSFQACIKDSREEYWVAFAMLCRTRCHA